MIEPALSVREIQETDIELIIAYWLTSDSLFLQSIGVDPLKLPTREQLTQALLSQLSAPLEQKKAYCIIWLVDKEPVGHSNVNPIIFGEEAYMHLHLWNRSIRRKGVGTELVKLTLPYFFENLQLKNLYSEPYALNEAPNKTLQKAGFDFVKEYTTTPGSLNFEQPVKRWQLSYEKFRTLNNF